MLGAEREKLHLDQMGRSRGQHREIPVDVRSGQEHEEDRRVRADAEGAGQDLQQRVVGPLRVVDDDGERAVGRVTGEPMP